MNRQVQSYDFGVGVLLATTRKRWQGGQFAPCMRGSGRGGAWLSNRPIGHLKAEHRMVRK
jgi:hypothetical protein